MASSGSAIAVVVQNAGKSERSSELVFLLRGGDDEGGSPSNDAPEAIVFTALPCRSYERKRRLSNGRTLEPPRRKKSRGVDVVPQTEPRMLRRRARGSNVVADSATPRVSSTAAGLPRPPRRRFVAEPLPPDERIPIPQVDHFLIETFLGLRHRSWKVTGPQADFDVLRTLERLHLSESVQSLSIVLGGPEAS